MKNSEKAQKELSVINIQEKPSYESCSWDECAVKTITANWDDTVEQLYKNNKMFGTRYRLTKGYGTVSLMNGSYIG